MINGSFAENDLQLKASYMSQPPCRPLWYINDHGIYHEFFVYAMIMAYTARSVEDETRNDRRNANRNPEWWGDFSQLSRN